MEVADETPHAYVPFRPAVKSSQPHDNVISGAKISIYNHTSKKKVGKMQKNMSMMTIITKKCVSLHNNS